MLASELILKRSIQYLYTNLSWTAIDAWWQSQRPRITHRATKKS